MKARKLLSAGTALAMLMTTPALAIPAAGGIARHPAAAERPLVLAQAASVEELRRRLAEEELTDAQRAEIEAQIEALEAAPPEEAPAEEAPAAEAPAEQPAAEEPAPEQAPAEQAPTQEAPAEQPAPEAAPAEPAPTQEAPAEPAPAEEAPAEPEAAPTEPAPAEQAPAAEQPAPAESAPAETAPAEQAPAEAAPTQEAPAPAEQAPAEAPATETAPAEPAPEQPAAEQPVTEQPAPEAAPATEAPAEQAPATEAPAEQAPAEGAAAPAETPPPVAADPAQDPEGVLPQNAAPVLDSAKEAATEQPAVPAGGAAQPAPQQQAAPAEPAAPPPATDAEAQAQAQPAQVESATAVEGTRVDAAEIDRRRQERENREGEQFVRELGGRLLFELGRQLIVQSDDRDRIGRGSREVYYEDLPGGWTRETVVRDNGSHVVTIRDRYGDVIRRSRITPDGREYVLVYAGDRDRERDRDRPRQWRDPGRDLPPLRLTIPVSQYILDARRAQDVDDYYDFLDQPPVEPVRRLYSVDEVKYSARIRDSVRRIDLDTLTFAFGSAAIEESEVGKLQAVADAMTRMLDENPAETFLIEGHTDAVGTDQANLALSDRRAETIAAALTDVFGIPPENLVTQGYGERYLKVATQEQNRDNRRVAIRRITPLVAPVASAN
jgi:outer membrane protein OmpA-like peptidoglycan-associated protein